MPAAALFALFTAACTSVEESDAELTVMSFNIRNANARDGKNRWALRKGLTLRVIQEIDPDLLGLQESFPEQTRFVSEGLPEHECYELGRRGEGKREESCAVLWRRERFEVLDRGTFWLGPKPSRIAKGWDAALPRICTWLRLKDRETGRRFVFANTHFDHRGRRARFESAKLLASQWPGEAVVLTGDLNAGEDSRPLAAMRDRGFVDSYRSLYPNAEAVGTFTGFRRRNSAKIDYVLLRGASDVRSARIVTTQYAGRWPSDHLPVTATFAWR